jgi:hypothetical protein
MPGQFEPRVVSTCPTSTSHKPYSVVVVPPPSPDFLVVSYSISGKSLAYVYSLHFPRSSTRTWSSDSPTVCRTTGSFAHLLVEEARTYAWPDVLERIDQLRRGHSHRLFLSLVHSSETPPTSRHCPEDHQRSCS